MHQPKSNMSKDKAAPPDGGGGLGSASEIGGASNSILRTPTNQGLGLFSNAPIGGEAESLSMSQNLKMRAAELRQREQQDRRLRQRADYAGKLLTDRSLPVFDQQDQIHILAHANNMGAEPMDYIQQCEDYVRENISTSGVVTEAMLEELITELMDNLPTPRRTTRVITDAKGTLEKVMEKFTGLTSQLISQGIELDEDLVEYQNSMQVLYSRLITVMDAAAIQEKWEVAETNKMKGQVKEVHSRATSILNQAKKQKKIEMDAAKTTRRETQVTSLIGDIDASIGSTGILTERVASEVEETAAKLTQEASLLDKEIDEIALGSGTGW